MSAVDWWRKFTSFGTPLLEISSCGLPIERSSSFIMTRARYVSAPLTLMFMLLTINGHLISTAAWDAQPGPRDKSGDYSCPPSLCRCPRKLAWAPLARCASL